MVQRNNRPEFCLSSPDRTFGSSDMKHNALVDAMSALRLKANKDALQDLLNSVKDLDLTLYTKESVQVFETALVKANDVMPDETLSEDDQKIVDDMVRELKDARDKLVLKDKNTDENNNGGQNSGGTNQDKVSYNKPKTGDSNSLIIMIPLSKK